MTLPISPVVLPSDLAGKTNGQLPDSMLTEVGPKGKLHHLAARAFKALQAACEEIGLPLTYTYGGTYRSYAEQEYLFRSRYAIGGTGGGCKLWNTLTWCKISSSMATAATPGSSNHGWGLAIDTAWDRDTSDGIGPDDATAITSHQSWPWLLANASRFGFSWELQSEPWHIRYVAGDNLPKAVLDFETEPTPTPPPDNPDQETTDMIRIDYKPNTQQWVSMVLGATTVSHTVNGHHAAVLLRGKVPQTPVTTEDLKGILLSVKPTNKSPFAPDKPSANAELHTAWLAAQARQ